MPTRLASLVIDAVDPDAVTRFWYILLGGTARAERDGGSRLVAPDVGSCGIDMVFRPVAGPKTGKNRIHVDIGSESVDEYQILTSLAVQVGARTVNVGQGPGVPWTVFEDPEGNEFCIVRPTEIYDRGTPLAALVVDSVDPHAMAAFWSVVTGWPVRHTDENSAALRCGPENGPWIEFLRVSGRRRSTGRVRFDVTAVDEEPESALARLLELGAGHDPATGELADPEGNRFRLVASAVARP